MIEKNLGTYMNLIFNRIGLRFYWVKLLGMHTHITKHFGSDKLRKVHFQSRNSKKLKLWEYIKSMGVVQNTVFFSCPNSF